MPELPEVETVVRGLRDPLVGRTLLSAIFPGPTRSMTNIDHAAFNTRIKNQRVVSVGRRAKYILITLTQDTLLIHLKMTGRLYVRPVNAPVEDGHLRVRFPLDNGQELRFSDARRFGLVHLVADVAAALPDLGPEPLEESFTVAVLHERLARRKGNMKALLLDQSFVAGIGNIYADESLHLAGIHPLRHADTLTDAEVALLHSAIRSVLEQGIAHEGASVNWYRKPDGERGTQQDFLRVYHDPRQQAEKHCQTCGTRIAVIRVASRGTHFCPHCQPLDHPKSDKID